MARCVADWIRSSTSPSAGCLDVTTAHATARFITFEGGEGTGKSTQAQLLADRLRSAAIRCDVTREPGGTPFAERVRELILDPETPPHASLAEALLFFAARADHLDALVRPALARGTWIICDRFIDSTRAYQGAAGGLDATVIDGLESIVVGQSRPDLTIVLDLPVETAFARVASRRARNHQGAMAEHPDPYESRDVAFHERLRQGFLDIAAREPHRCTVIDAARPVDDIADAVWKEVQARLVDGEV